jgi:tRNA modification GTPase
LYEPQKSPSRDTILDSGALVLFFPGPKTVTGEDVLELHVHGGPAVVKAVLGAIPRCSAAKNELSSSSVTYAEPGEFTRRAFLNGRLDLTQIEALGDTLSATTEQQRRLSVRGVTGGLTKRYESWRHMLLSARGELEALIDFSEDQHFDESPVELASSVASQVRGLTREITAHITNAARGELLRNGISLALLGAPNAGKSSLLNRIVGREAAIVSAEAGTTRDVVEVGIDLGGWFCRLGDMAGIRVDRIEGHSGTQSRGVSVVGSIEQEGIKRAKERALQSDVVLVVLSLESDPQTGELALHMEPDVLTTARSIIEDSGCVVVIVNKMDRANESSRATLKGDWTREIVKAMPGLSRDHVFHISCKEAMQSPSTISDPGGIQILLDGLVRVFKDLTSAVTPTEGASTNDEIDRSMWEESLGTNARQSTLLHECLRHLEQFLQSVGTTSHGTAREDINDEKIDIVVAAESLRLAASCLGKILGKGDASDVEEVLGVVFEKYVPFFRPLDAQR